MLAALQAEGPAMDDKAHALRAYLIASDLTREQLIDALVTIGSDARAATAALEQARAFPDSPLAQAAALADVATWLDRIVSPARELVAESEAARRRANGAKGGAPPHFTDDDLLSFLAEWQATQKHKRGRIKAAARHFGVWDKAIQKRLKVIAEKQEPTG